MCAFPPCAKRTSLWIHGVQKDLQKAQSNLKHTFLPETHHKPLRNVPAVEILLTSALLAERQMADKDWSDKDSSPSPVSSNI